MHYYHSSFLQVFHDVQIRLLKDYPDYTESLNTLISGYDILVSYFGSDEDDLHDHIDVSAAFFSCC